MSTRRRSRDARSCETSQLLIQVSPDQHSDYRRLRTSKSFSIGAETRVPFVRAVVSVRDSRLDGRRKELGGPAPVKKPTSPDRPCAHKRYTRSGYYVAAAFIGARFPTAPSIYAESRDASSIGSGPYGFQVPSSWPLLAFYGSEF